MGRRHGPGQLLPLGAQHLCAVILSRLLVRFDPAGATLPGDGTNVLISFFVPTIYWTCSESHDGLICILEIFIEIVMV